MLLTEQDLPAGSHALRTRAGPAELTEVQVAYPGEDDRAGRNGMMSERWNDIWAGRLPIRQGEVGSK